MKKITLIILFLLFTMLAKAQANIQIAIDPKMALEGAYETSTSGAIDLIARVSDRTYNYEVGLQAEIFTSLKPSYFSYGVFYNKIVNITNKHEMYIGLEGNFLMRKLERSTAGFLSIGANTGYRFNFNSFAIGLEANYKTRPDFKALWNSTKIGTFSGYITFTYKFKKI
jgi:hypothetical protein